MKTKNAKQSKNVVKNVKSAKVSKNNFAPDTEILDELGIVPDETIVETTKPVKTIQKREKTGICAVLINFFTPLIEQKSYTKKELIAIAHEKLGDFNKLTAETLLIDSRNERYNKFSRLVVRDEKGVLSFA